MATMCQNHPDLKATFVGTVLEPDVVNVAVCDECMPLFCAAVFEEMTGVDMSPALYLASQEGQENPDGSPQGGAGNGQAGEPAGAATGTEPAPDHPSTEEAEAIMEAAQTGHTPEQAPADDDEEAGWDFTRPPGQAGPTSSGSPDPGMGDAPAGSGHAPPANQTSQAAGS